MRTVSGKGVVVLALQGLALLCLAPAVPWAQTSRSGGVVGGGPVTVGADVTAGLVRGTHFDLAAGASLVSAVDSTIEIDVLIHATPKSLQMAVSPAQAAPDAPPAGITLSGLLPATTYYRYTDDFEHLDVVVTDDQGQHAFSLDQSAPHLVILQPDPSTVHLHADGTGCPFIGTWDAGTLTCTMRRNVLQTIEIDDDGLTLDGNGYTIDGTGTFSGTTGVLVGRHGNVTVRNVIIDSVPTGVIASGSSDSTFENITVRNGNGGFFEVFTSPSSGAGRNTFRNSSVTVVCDPPDTPCGFGFSAVLNTDDTVSGNTFINAKNGAASSVSVRPVITGNTLADCDTGVSVLAALSAATVSGNTITGGNTGLVVNTAVGCEIRGNVIDGPTVEAARLGSRECQVTDNSFMNSAVGLNVQGDLNTIVHNRFVANTVQAQVSADVTGNLLSQPPRIGGNHWSDFDEAAEGCVDADADGYCDLAHDVTGGTDLNPWAADRAWLDVTPPTTGVTLNGVAGLAGWWVSAVSATFTAVDDPGGTGVLRSEYGADGVNFSPATGPVGIATEGTNSLFYRSIDRAGNPGTAQSVEVKIDTVPPTLTATLSPAANASGWNNAAVTVSFTCADATSGVATCAASQSFSGEGANQEASGSATDTAGNTGSLTQDVSIDLTAPSIDLAGGCGTSALLNHALSTNVTVADALSGVGTQSAPNGPATLATSSIGPKSRQFTASDLAGNSAAATCNYSVIYDFLGAGGFKAPVDPPPIVNVAKAGSAIPVKWQLPDGLGGYLSSLAVVTSIQAQQVSCAQFTNALADPIDTNAAGASGLHFDTTAMQYVYNWKTAPMMNGKCFSLNLNFNDGRTYRADFRFTK